MIPEVQTMLLMLSDYYCITSEKGRCFSRILGKIKCMLYVKKKKAIVKLYMCKLRNACAVETREWQLTRVLCWVAQSCLFYLWFFFLFFFFSLFMVNWINELLWKLFLGYFSDGFVPGLAHSVIWQWLCRQESKLGVVTWEWQLPINHLLTSQNGFCCYYLSHRKCSLWKPGNCFVLLANLQLVSMIVGIQLVTVDPLTVG